MYNFTTKSINYYLSHMSIISSNPTKVYIPAFDRRNKYNSQENAYYIARLEIREGEGVSDGEGKMAQNTEEERGGKAGGEKEKEKEKEGEEKGEK